MSTYGDACGPCGARGEWVSRTRFNGGFDRLMGRSRRDARRAEFRQDGEAFRASEGCPERGRCGRRQSGPGIRLTSLTWDTTPGATGGDPSWMSPSQER